MENLSFKQSFMNVVSSRINKSSFIFGYIYALFITLAYFFMFTKLSFGILLLPIIIPCVLSTIIIIVYFVLFIIDWIRSLKKKETNND